MLKKLFTLIAVTLVACSASAETTEMTVSLSSGSNEIVLSGAYDHFLISVTEELTVRFVSPITGPDGSVSRFDLTPPPNPGVADGSGPRPDFGDSTMTCGTAETWNTYNDIFGAKKILLHGSAGGTTAIIRCKR